MKYGVCLRRLGQMVAHAGPTQLQLLVVGYEHLVVHAQSVTLGMQIGYQLRAVIAIDGNQYA